MNAEANRKDWLKNVLGFGGAIAAYLLIYLLLPSDAMSEGARRLGGMFGAALVLWATEVLPIAVTSLLVIAVGPILGVFESVKDAASGFTTSVIFFIIASFVLSIAIGKSGVAKRLALWLITRAGTETKRILFVFMFGCAIISSIMSDVPSSAIWMSLALPILDKMGVIKGKSKFAKAMMIGIPVAAFTGGIATPAGSSINVLAISLLKQVSNINITFVQWMAIGIPMFLVTTFAAWWILTKVFPPEEKSIGDVSFFKEEQKALGPWSENEKKTLVILGFMLAFWVASSWIKWLDITMVSIIGAAVMFLPGVRLLNWHDTEKSIGWDSILIVGSVTSLGIAATKLGLSTWVVESALGGMASWPVFVALLVIAVFTVLIHFPIPINPTIISAIVPAIVVLAVNSGVNPALYALTVTFTTSCAFLVPLDAVTLVTYSKGYYRMFDMLLPGSLISIVWVLLITVLVYFVGPLIGFI